MDGGDPVAAVRSVFAELEQFSPELAQKERWLVFNKVDLLPPESVDSQCQKVLQALDWQGPVFKISALQRKGTKELCYRLMDYLAH